METSERSHVEILQEEVDEDYEPTDQEIREYAEWLGINADEDQDLLWIARRGLMTPLPKPWKPCQSTDGEIFYFNPLTGENTWDHPCDAELRELYATERAKKKSTKAESGGAAAETAHTEVARETVPCVDDNHEPRSKREHADGMPSTSEATAVPDNAPPARLPPEEHVNMIDSASEATPVPDKAPPPRLPLQEHAAVTPSASETTPSPVNAPPPRLPPPVPPVPHSSAVSGANPPGLGSADLMQPLPPLGLLGPLPPLAPPQNSAVSEANPRAVKSDESQRDVPAATTANATTNSATDELHTHDAQLNDAVQGHPSPAPDRSTEDRLASDALSPPTPDLVSILAAELHPSVPSEAKETDKAASRALGTIAQGSEAPDATTPYCTAGREDIPIQPNSWLLFKEDNKEHSHSAAVPAITPKKCGESRSIVASPSLEISSLSDVPHELSPQPPQAAEARDNGQRQSRTDDGQRQPSLWLQLKQDDANFVAVPAVTPKKKTDICPNIGSSSLELSSLSDVFLEHLPEKMFSGPEKMLSNRKAATADAERELAFAQESGDLERFRHALEAARVAGVSRDIVASGEHSLATAEAAATEAKRELAFAQGHGDPKRIRKALEVAMAARVSHEVIAAGRAALSAAEARAVAIKEAQSNLRIALTSENLDQLSKALDAARAVGLDASAVALGEAVLEKLKSRATAVAGATSRLERAILNAAQSPEGLAEALSEAHGVDGVSQHILDAAMAAAWAIGRAPPKNTTPAPEFDNHCMYEEVCSLRKELGELRAELKERKEATVVHPSAAECKPKMKHEEVDPEIASSEASGLESTIRGTLATSSRCPTLTRQGCWDDACHPTQAATALLSGVGAETTLTAPSLQRVTVTEGAQQFDGGLGTGLEATLPGTLASSRCPTLTLQEQWNESCHPPHVATSPSILGAEATLAAPCLQRVALAEHIDVAQHVGDVSGDAIIHGSVGQSEQLRLQLQALAAARATGLPTDRVGNANSQADVADEVRSARDTGSRLLRDAQRRSVRAQRDVRHHSSSRNDVESKTESQEEDETTSHGHQETMSFSWRRDHGVKCRFSVSGPGNLREPFSASVQADGCICNFKSVGGANRDGLRSPLEAMPALENNAQRGQLAVETSSAPRAAPSVTSGSPPRDLPDLQHGGRKENRREHATLEEDKNLWQGGAQSGRRRAEGNSMHTGFAEMEMLGDESPALDIRNDVRNSSGTERLSSPAHHGTKEATPLAEANSVRAASSSETSSAARAAAAAVRGELPEFLQGWRRELRREHATLEEDRRLWRCEAQRVKRRTEQNPMQTGSAEMEILGEVRTALDARAAVLNGSIGEYRCLERLYAAGKCRNRCSKSAPRTHRAQSNGSRRRSSSSSATKSRRAEDVADMRGPGSKSAFHEEELRRRWQHVLPASRDTCPLRAGAGGA